MTKCELQAKGLTRSEAVKVHALVSKGSEAKTRDAKRTRLLQKGWTAGRCWPHDGIEEWFAPNGDTYHLQWVPGATTYYAFNPMA